MRSWHYWVVALGMALVPTSLIAQDVTPGFAQQKENHVRSPAALTPDELLHALASTGNPPSAAQRTVTVTATDTLWNIARTNRPSGNITIKQALLAIQDANPHAFPSNNINEMEVGSRLRIPDAASMLRRTAEEAEAEVRRQNQVWVATSAPPVPQLRLQPIARESAAVPAQPVVIPQQDNTDAPNVTVQQPVRDEENARLRATVESLEAELSDLRQQLQDRAEQPVTADVDVADISDLQAQLQQAQAAVQASEEQMQRMREQFIQLRNQQMAPAPVATGLAADIQRQPLLYVGMTIGLLLLLFFFIAWMMARSKLTSLKRELNDVEENYRRQQASALAAGVPLTDNPVVAQPFEDQREPETSSIDASSARAARPATARDPLIEVEMYLAYGRMEQAAGFLVTALEQEPNREDLRLKLLEILAELDDENEFAQQLAELKAHSPSASGLKRADELSRQLTNALPAAAIGSRIKSEASADEQDDLGDLRIGISEDLGELELDDILTQDSNAAHQDTHSYDFDIPVDDLSDLSDLEDLADMPNVPAGNQDGIDYEVPHKDDFEPVAPNTGADEFLSALDELDGNSAATNTDRMSDSFDELSDLSDLPEISELSDENYEALAGLQPQGDGHSYELTDLDDPADLEVLDLSNLREPEADEALVAEDGPSLEMAVGDAQEMADAVPVSDTLTNEDELRLDDDLLLEEADEPLELTLEEDESLDLDKSLDATLLDEDQLLDEDPELSLESLDDDLGDDFDLNDGDLTTQLDLATAYIEMGDKAGAREVLQRVVEEGNSDQRATALQMLESLTD